MNALFVTIRARRNHMKHFIMVSWNGHTNFLKTPVSSCRPCFDSSTIDFGFHFVGSMFRLYRKSGFDTHKALVALRDTLKFRIEHRRQLLWSPIKYDTPTNSPETIKLPERKTSSSSSRRDSASSRTSAQSPRASPAPGWDPSGNPESPKRALKEDASPQGGVEESLLQLYPHSTSDPNKRPIIVVSLKHLDQERSSKDTKGNVSSSLSTPPTIQALSAFERLRCYLAESAWKEEHPPLQFILLINLSGGRVSTTVRSSRALLSTSAHHSSS